jgi:hypothetical protein
VVRLPGKRIIVLGFGQQLGGFGDDAVEGVDADGEVGAVDEAAAGFLDRAAYFIEPVQPTTVATPNSASRIELSATVSGIEKSMATSTSVRFSAVSPAPPALLSSSRRLTTANPCSGASWSNILPIRP